MAGLIREDDIALVRERADIVEIVRQYVTLKPAGGGAFKGLCPFHDEKSPSFHVRPGKGYFCFGCGEGGDVISFLMKHDGLPFNQAVEYLADKTGVQLRYTEGDGPAAQRRDPNPRHRLVEANKLAQEFYAGHLAGPDGMAGTAVPRRARLRQGGRRRRSGSASRPRDGDALYKHLRQKQFTDAELVAAGLVAEGQRGHYDRFRGRLLWPIRETSGETIGFGARRIFDDDRIEAKYLNTPETSIYKKSHVLYGIDLARREIARSSQAVVVEGYTDVMACHLAGVPTAVATCGTAFGEDHGRVLRRLLHDHEEFRGEVIFTFDGDEAGQKAALRAFGGDQQFVGQTYVAVEPDGLDPCDLRLQKGDAAVRELVARRIPLYRFVLGNVVSRYDLDRADGRVDALREAAKLVSSIRDRSKVDAFSRELAGMVGVEIEEARAEVRRAANRSCPEPAAPASAATGREPPPRSAAAGPPLPDLRDPRFALERETLKLVVQQPRARRPLLRRPRRQRLHPPDLPGRVGDRRRPGRTGGRPGARRLGRQAPRLGGRPGGRRPRAPVVRAFNALAVEPLLASGEPAPAYAAAHVFRLQELTAMRRIADLKSKLQRTNPVEEAGRVQPDVRRARRAGEPPAHAAGARDRRRRLMRLFSRGPAAAPAGPRGGRRQGPGVGGDRGRHLAGRHPRRVGRRGSADGEIETRSPGSGCSAPTGTSRPRR